MLEDLKEVQLRMSAIGRRDIAKALQENHGAAARLLQLLRSGDIEQARDVAALLAESYRTIAESL